MAVGTAHSPEIRRSIPQAKLTALVLTGPESTDTHEPDAVVCAIDLMLRRMEFQDRLELSLVQAAGEFLLTREAGRPQPYGATAHG